MPFNISDKISTSYSMIDYHGDKITTVKIKRSKKALCNKLHDNTRGYEQNAMR